MSEELIKNAFSVMDDFELNDEEIEKINQLLMSSIKDNEDSDSSQLFNSFQKQIAGKINIDENEIYKFLSDSIDSDKLNSLQKEISKNQELIDYLQELFMEKMLS